MPTLASIGAELTEVPIGHIVSQLAQGIADGQRSLDQSSVKALIDLANTPVQVIPEITEIITGEQHSVPISGGAPVLVTGVRVNASAAAPVTMSALQAGILPTFYQFSEATLAVKLSVQVREVSEVDTDGTVKWNFLMFASNVNFKTQNQYSYGADAASSVTATLRPVPPPTRLIPATITVNTLTKPPTTTVTT